MLLTLSWWVWCSGRHKARRARAKDCRPWWYSVYQHNLGVILLRTSYTNFSYFTDTPRSTNGPAWPSLAKTPTPMLPVVLIALKALMESSQQACTRLTVAVFNITGVYYNIGTFHVYPLWATGLKQWQRDPALAICRASANIILNH